MKHEVGSAISGFLHPANENIVRLAACSLARQIFLNIGSRISQLTDEIMRDLYRTMKTIAYDHLQNDDLREKAALAIESIDDAVRELFKPNKKMEKKITVLN